ncbi:MAG: hypothetical protein P4L87_12760, partial [Formivibrio sp.]|nr:hypothetical protein [Formivibrio sp.]
MVFAIPSQVRENQFVTRVDATLSPNHTLYGRYFLDGYSNAAFYSPTNILITSQSGNKERAQALTIAETWIINQHTVNTFHASGTRRRDNRGPADGGINATTIGVTTYEPVPVGLNLAVNSKFSTYCGSCAVGHFNINTFSYTDDVNISFGKHQLSFGGEIARSQLNDTNTYLANGAFTFKGQYSKTGPAGTSKGGTALNNNLDFLTGAMSSYQQSIFSTSAVRSLVPSLYVQDTYHATQNFVVSAGVRWEPEVWPVDYFNRGTAFNMSNFLSNTISTAYPTAPAGLLFYGDKGIPRTITKSSLWQFS